MRLSCNPYRLALLLSAVAVALSGPTLTAGPASASTTEAAMMSLGDPTGAPALGAGYVYWTKETSPKGSTFPTVSVYQRRLIDGRERILLRAHRARIGSLYAKGDKLAFSLTKIKRAGSHKRTTLVDDRVYAMSAEDPAPTAVVAGSYTIKMSKRITHRGSRRITTIRFAICGRLYDLYDVNTVGQVLVDKHSISCKTKKATQNGQIYSLTGAAPIRVHSVEESLVASVQFGHLFTNPFDTVDVTDIATGTKRRLKGHLLVDQVVMDANGYIATVAESDTSEDHSYIRIYRPGASKPSVRIKRKLSDLPSVIFCAGGLVELSEPGRGPMLLTLRGLDGKVLSRVKGPRTGLDYDASCEGRRLTLAVVRGRGKPAVLGYDL